MLSSCYHPNNIPSDHPNINVHSIIITTTDKSSHLITSILSHYYHPNIIPLLSPQYYPLLSPQYYPIIITPILSHLITPILSSMASSSQQLTNCFNTYCMYRWQRIIFTIINYHLKGFFFAATNNA